MSAKANGQELAAVAESRPGGGPMLGRVVLSLVLSCLLFGAGSVVLVLLVVLLSAPETNRALGSAVHLLVFIAFVTPGMAGGLGAWLPWRRELGAGPSLGLAVLGVTLSAVPRVLWRAANLPLPVPVSMAVPVTGTWLLAWFLCRRKARGGVPTPPVP